MEPRGTCRQGASWHDCRLPAEPARSFQGLDVWKRRMQTAQYKPGLTPTVVTCTHRVRGGNEALEPTDGAPPRPIAAPSTAKTPGCQPHAPARGRPAWI